MRLVDDLAEKLDRLGAKLESVAAGAEKIGGAAKTAGSRATGTSAPKTTAQKVDTAATVDTPSAPKAPKLPGGAEQRLLKIPEQRAQAALIEDTKLRIATLKDLDTAEFRARRSIVLNQRRLAQGAKALNADGLLESFEKLNHLMRLLAAGDVVGAARSATNFAGMFVPKEKDGGLNVIQRTARTFNAPNPFDEERLRKAIGGKPSGAPDLGEFALPKLSDFALPDAAKGAESLAGATEGAAAGVEGLTAVMGPLALVVAAETAAVVAFVAVVKRASERLNSFATDIAIGGGSTRDVAGLQSYGIAPGQGAALAKAFRESISLGSGNLFSLLGAGRLGIAPQLPREYGGNVNELGLLNKALDRLSRLPAEERQSIARQNPVLEQFLPKLEAINRNRGALDRDQRRSDAIMGDTGAAQSAQDVALQLGRVSVNFNLLFTALGKPGLKLAADGLGLLADAVGTLAEWAEKGQPVISAVVLAADPFLGTLKQIGDLFKIGGAVFKWAGDQWDRFVDDLRHSPFAFIAQGVDLLGEALNHLGPTLGGLIKRIAGVIAIVDPLAGAGLKFAADQLMQDPTADLKASQKAHSQAMGAHTQAMMAHVHAMGTYGGGQRTRSAIPSALKGTALQVATENQMLRDLGAFSF